MGKLTLTLQERCVIAESTMSFRFDLGGQAWAFRPGQFVRVTLINPPFQDEKGSARSLSIASSPQEPGLLVATRMTGSAFKRVLRELPLGAPVQVAGPFGAFVLDNESSAPAVFLAGGIGITPFRAMIRDALDRGSSRAMTLFYANRTPEDAAFLDEFEAWKHQSAGFRLVAIMSQAEKSRRGWTGRTGLLDAALLRETLGDASRPAYYAAGPPRFMAGVQAALTQAGVRQEQIHEDEFMGYP